MSVSAKQINTFVDPLDEFSFPEFQAVDRLGNVNTNSDPNHWTNRFQDFLGISHVSSDYQKWLDKYNKAYEKAQLNSARAYEQYITKYGKALEMEGLKEAGYNPWLALQNGVGQAGSSGLGVQNSAKKENDLKSSNKDGFRSVGLFLLATAKLLALI